MGWVTADAPTKAELSACVECGLCLPHCPTFRLTGRETASPRGRLGAMSAVAAGIVPIDDVFEETMSFCLQCRACEAVCPGLVPFGRAMEGARAELTVQRPNIRRRLRHLVVGRGLSNRSLLMVMARLATFGRRFPKLLPSRLGRPLAGLRAERSQTWAGRIVEPDGMARATVGLLPGCVMDPLFGEVHRAAVGLAVMAGYRVVVPVAAVCCGALAAHDGAAAHTRRLAALNVAAFAGCDLVVADAAGCSAHLKEYRHWTEGGGGLTATVLDVTELVGSAIEEGRLPTLGVDRGPVAVQDPCHLRHAQRQTAAPRRILRAAGYRPVEIDPDGLCCGAAGLYSLLRPAASHELGARKAAQVVDSGSSLVASANPGCEMQLRSHLPAHFRIAHPVELYWEALGEEG